MRHFSQLGINMTFQQSVLDDYDYAVTNLTLDLRDGVVLAKVVDILTNSELSNKLRVPAISRLQKVISFIQNKMVAYDFLMFFNFCTDLQCRADS